MTDKKTWVAPAVVPLATAKDAQNAVGIVADGGFLRGRSS